MNNPIQPLARASVDSSSSVSSLADTAEVSRDRQKELATQLFKDLAKVDLPAGPPETTPGTTPRVYG